MPQVYTHVMNSGTEWYVVTDGPSSGKTTTVELLKKRRYRTSIEHAKHYIDTKRITSKTVGEIGIKRYAKYLLEEGSMHEKRDLLAQLKGKLVMKDKKISLAA